MGEIEMTGYQPGLRRRTYEVSRRGENSSTTRSKWNHVKQALSDFMGLDEDVDAVDASVGTAANKWQKRTHSLATSAFLGNLASIRQRAAQHDEELMSTLDKGYHWSPAPMQKPVPVQAIDTSVPGKRTQRRTYHRHPQDNVFSLAYQEWNEWMYPTTATSRKPHMHSRSFAPKDLMDAGSKQADQQLHVGGSSSKPLDDLFFNDINAYESYAGEDYKRHVPDRGQVRPGVPYPTTSAGGLDVVDSYRDNYRWQEMGGWLFHGSSESDDRAALLPSDERDDEVDLGITRARFPIHKDIRQNLPYKADRESEVRGLFMKIWKHGLFESCLCVSDEADLRFDQRDHRPFFTYWLTFVQVIILITAVSVYGFAPFGVTQSEVFRLVMQPSLSYEKVSYFEQDNFWVGPRMPDLVHLGAKYSPCIRLDENIKEVLDAAIVQENTTGCCVNNDGSGCVQSVREECSSVLSSWIKWDKNSPAMRDELRTSGAVCGIDPKYCKTPASHGAYAWPDDITKWPICERMDSNPPMTTDNRHVTCEILGRPCCIGIKGECTITTYDHCSFLRGYFHEKATLCSQVQCMEDVCGMLPFANPEVPDQFYRFWITLFLHAGIIHLLITLVINLFVLRPLEKMAGWIRISLIFLLSGMAGSMASAIFLPYRVEAGPSGGQFGVLGCYLVWLILNRRQFEQPLWVIGKFSLIILVLILLGFLPMIDNWSHIFGLVFGILISFIVLPFVRSKKVRRWVIVAVCIAVFSSLVAMLVLLFYVTPVYECDACQYFTCIPFTETFCDSNKIAVTETRYT